MSSIGNIIENNIYIFAYLAVALAVILVLKFMLLRKKKRKPVSKVKPPRGLETPKVNPGAYKKDPGNYLRSIPKVAGGEAAPKSSTFEVKKPRLWFSQTHRSILPEVQADIVHAAFNPELTRLFTINTKDWVERFDVYKKGKVEAYYPHPGGARALATISNARGDFVLSGGYDGRIMLASSALYEPEKVLEAHKGYVTAFAVAPNARPEKQFQFISAGDDLFIRFWDTSGELLGQTLLPIKGQTDGVDNTISAICFTPDSKSLLIISSNGASWLWRFNCSGLEALTVLPKRPVNVAEVYYQGDMVVGRDHENIYCWEGTGDTQVLELRHSYDKIVGIAVSKAGIWCIDKHGVVGLE